MNQQENRYLHILKLLHKNKAMKVTELAQKTGVSLVTMRKDLAALENKKLLLRYQGYAELNMRTPVNRRMISNYEEKIRIAQKAAELVNDGDTVIIESGSCCVLLADELKKSQKHITIITNSTFIADFITPYQYIKLILLGGEYQSDSMAVVGAVTKACLATFHAKFFFSGTDGYRKGVGFTGDNLERIDVLRTMMQQADKTVVITDSQKFSHQGMMEVFALCEADIVITDAGITQDAENELKQNNINFIKV